ncbi:MAG: alpha/beta fold hydrolase [Bacteroidales bacterium]|nr:alpha/beta fold hydrolase [Bacteroidales bacterium]
MLFYRKYGDPKGKPVVVLHGVLGLSDNWDNFGKRFAELGFYVIIPDMRNHGQSPRYETFNYKVMARDVKKVLDYEHITRCYVVGHSMGGKIAMMLAFENPQLVERLEVLDISPRKFDHPLQHLEFIAAMGSVDLRHVKRRADVEEQLEKYHFEKRVLLFLMKNLSYSHEHGFRWKPYLKSIYKNIAEISKGLEDKGVYDGPTLFIRGGKSDYIVEKDLPVMKMQLPNHQLVTLENSGHWIHVDDPEGFLRETEKFLLSV